MTAEEKLLLDKTEDLFRLCDKYASPVFSNFLDGGQMAVLSDQFHVPAGYGVLLFGGVEESERKLYGVFPEWMEPEPEVFPIVALKVTHSYGEPLSHRDYLGSLMGLGIDRNKTGDILIDGSSAYIFVMEDIAPYLRDNLEKIGSRGVTVSICPLDAVKIPPRQFEVLDAVAASLRADAILAAALNLSRSAAGKLIESGKLSVNHRVLEDGAKNLAAGDLISVRGFGRFQLDAAGGQTRKGRLHVQIKRFI